MKQSKRNIQRQVAKAEKRANGKPALSKYERKRRPFVVEASDQTEAAS